MELPAIELTVAASPLARYWYGASIRDFLAANSDEILGQLSRNCSFPVLPTQRDAWLAQIEFLNAQLTGLTGSIFFEFSIPRMGRRIDVVVIVGPVVFAIEFKVGERTLDRAARDQVWDYALDLKNFHKASHDVAIVPILVATEATDCPPLRLHAEPDQVYRPIEATIGEFRNALDAAIAHVRGRGVDPTSWSHAPYHPTPTIVEAARALYAHHSVEAIARFDAGAKNLQVTSRRIEELVDEARTERRKRICFVTGVPGAGKTLVGLNIATRRSDPEQPTHSVFLSGNGPLVAVLREALTRDDYTRRKAAGEKVRKGEIAAKVKAFIQNVHHFRDDGLIDSAAPIDHVVIFDEAHARGTCGRRRTSCSARRTGRAFHSPSPSF